jgi:hypothetical protein
LQFTECLIDEYRIVFLAPNLLKIRGSASKHSRASTCDVLVHTSVSISVSLIALNSVRPYLVLIAKLATASDARSNHAARLCISLELPSSPISEAEPDD